MGDVKVALSIRKRMLELEGGSLDVLDRYGQALLRTGRLSEAELVFRTILSIWRSQHSDPLNLDTLSLINNLALVLQFQGKLAEAEPMLRETLAERRQLLGNSHPHTLHSINNLASLCRAQGKLTEAEPLSREALAERRQVLGSSHPDTLTSIGNLALLLRQQGKLAEAEPLFREALDRARQVLGNSHLLTLSPIIDLASLLREQGKLTEAEPLCREAVAWQLPPSHSELHQQSCLVGSSARQAG